MSQTPKYAVGDTVDLLLCGKVKDKATKIKNVKLSDVTNNFAYQIETRGHTWFSELLIRRHTMKKS